MDIIYAFGTPNIKSAIAVIRLSGESVFKILNIILKTQEIFQEKLKYCKIYSASGEVIDTGMYYYKQGDKTVTGEDYAELHLHGSNAVRKRMISLLEGLPGMRQAEQGEFTRRAFLNGKTDLTQAESVHDLITADTEYQRKVALKNLNGHSFTYLQTLSNKIYDILSLLEAELDFSEEDISEKSVSQLHKKIHDLIEKNLTILSKGKSFDRVLKSGLKVSILGLPNAGKSSFINHFTGKHAAIVTDIPGTTRDIIEISLDVAGYPVTLIDTAGLRNADCVIEKEGIKRAISAAYDADVVFLLTDVNAIEENKRFFNIIPERFQLIYTKFDTVKQEDKAFYEDKFVYSVKNNQYIEKIETYIKEFFEQHYSAEQEFFLKERYVTHIKEANKYLKNALLNLEKKHYILAAENLKSAIGEFAHITGKYNIETVLDGIFSKFCIGK